MVSMMKHAWIFVFVGCILGHVAVRAASQKEGTPPPPGTVICASPDYARTWPGSPSFEVMPDGSYLSSHDLWGNAPLETRIYQSKDKGKTWKPAGMIPRMRHGMMFRLGATLFLLGVYDFHNDHGHNGSIAICRSTDSGKTWTVPQDEKTGLLLKKGKYEYLADPTPFLIHDGRLWKEVETVDYTGQDPRGFFNGFQPMCATAPVGCDLLNAANWTFSNALAWPKIPGFRGWAEGNAVCDRDGNVQILMRLERPDVGKSIGRIHVSADGRKITFDPQKDVCEFPGGSSKFVIRYDDASHKYWALSNWVQPGQKGFRTTLALVCSPDLKTWEVRSIIYQHARGNDIAGFNYCDWRAEGDDMIFNCRLGWYGKNFHDANYQTFDRIKDFRRRTRADDTRQFE
jgi:hypothetical protein